MLRCTKLLIASSVLTLAGCSSFSGDNSIIQNRETDYLKATTTPPLMIPPGLSSSKIEAHYPVSEKEYPSRTKKVKLTPPDLETTYVMPDISPVRGEQPNIASETAPTTAAAPVQVSATKQNIPDYYFDSHTRASTTKAGMPIADAMLAIWPWGKKKTTTPQTAPTTATTTTSSQGFSWSSLWPWHHAEQQPAVTAQNVPVDNGIDKGVDTKVATAQTEEEKQAALKSKMANAYFDRYNQH